MDNSGKDIFFDSVSGTPIGLIEPWIVEMTKGSSGIDCFRVREILGGMGYEWNSGGNMAETNVYPVNNIWNYFIKYTDEGVLHGSGKYNPVLHRKMNYYTAEDLFRIGDYNKSLESGSLNEDVYDDMVKGPIPLARNFSIIFPKPALDDGDPEKILTKVLTILDVMGYWWNSGNSLTEFEGRRRIKQMEYLSDMDGFTYDNELYLGDSEKYDAEDFLKMYEYNKSLEAKPLEEDLFDDIVNKPINIAKNFSIIFHRPTFDDGDPKKILTKVLTVLDEMGYKWNSGDSLTEFEGRRRIKQMGYESDHIGFLYHTALFNSKERADYDEHYKAQDFLKIYEYNKSLESKPLTEDVFDDITNQSIELGANFIIEFVNPENDGQLCFKVREILAEMGYTWSDNELLTNTEYKRHVWCPLYLLCIDNSMYYGEEESALRYYHQNWVSENYPIFKPEHVIKIYNHNKSLNEDFDFFKEMKKIKGEFNYRAGDVVRCKLDWDFNKNGTAGAGYRPGKVFTIGEVEYDSLQGDSILWPNDDTSGVYSIAVDPYMINGIQIIEEHDLFDRTLLKEDFDYFNSLPITIPEPFKIVFNKRFDNNGEPSLLTDVLVALDSMGYKWVSGNRLTSPNNDVIAKLYVRGSDYVTYGQYLSRDEEKYKQLTEYDAEHFMSIVNHNKSLNEDFDFFDDIRTSDTKLTYKEGDVVRCLPGFEGSDKSGYGDTNYGGHGYKKNYEFKIERVAYDENLDCEVLFNGWDSGVFSYAVEPVEINGVKIMNEDIYDDIVNDSIRLDDNFLIVFPVDGSPNLLTDVMAALDSMGYTWSSGGSLTSSLYTKAIEALIHRKSYHGMTFLDNFYDYDDYIGFTSYTPEEIIKISNNNKSLNEDFDFFDEIKKIDAKFNYKVGDVVRCLPGFKKEDDDGEFYSVRLRDGGMGYKSGMVFTVGRVSNTYRRGDILWPIENDQHGDGVFAYAVEPLEINGLKITEDFDFFKDLTDLPIEFPDRYIIKFDKEFTDDGSPSILTNVLKALDSMDHRWISDQSLRRHSGGVIRKIFVRPGATLTHGIDTNDSMSKYDIYGKYNAEDFLKIFNHSKPLKEDFDFFSDMPIILPNEYVITFKESFENDGSPSILTDVLMALHSMGYKWNSLKPLTRWNGEVMVKLYVKNNRTISYGSYSSLKKAGYDNGFDAEHFMEMVNHNKSLKEPLKEDFDFYKEEPIRLEEPFIIKIYHTENIDKVTELLDQLNYRWNSQDRLTQFWPSDYLTTEEDPYISLVKRKNNDITISKNVDYIENVVEKEGNYNIYTDTDIVKVYDINNNLNEDFDFLDELRDRPLIMPSHEYREGDIVRCLPGFSKDDGKEYSGGKGYEPDMEFEIGEVTKGILWPSDDRNGVYAKAVTPVKLVDRDI